MAPNPRALPAADTELYTLAGTIAPTRLSAAYRAGLVIVAAAMLLLPVVYVSLIVLVGLATWWHLTTNAGLLSGTGGTQWRLLSFLTPAIVGGVVVFFMVKPLLARPSKSADPMEIDPDAEPVIFEFVRQICAQVGAPVPQRVLVDCRVNASAGLLRGVFSRDLALTIGLPLAAGLSVRELGGVLAHEFGHFAQGGGMRLTAVVRGINGWFARVVYERDRWDEALERWSKAVDWRLAIVLAIARGAVWMSRKILAGLMWAGHAVSCFMMRQMEYDADSYEVKLAGTDAFTRTFTRLRELSVASQFAYSDLSDGVTAGSIPSDLPIYVVTRVTHMPAELLSRIRSTPSDKTGMFDTHPSDADRLSAAQAIGGAGVLVNGDAPATQLFSAFESLCAAATRHHYEQDLGLETDTLTLVSAEAAASDSGDRQARRRAVHTLFKGCVSSMRPIRIEMPPALPLDELVAASKSARVRMSALGSGGLETEYRRLEQLEHQRTDAVTATKLFDCGFTQVDPESFGLKKGTREEAVATAASRVAEQRALAARLQTFEAVVASRLAHGVALSKALRPAHATTPEVSADVMSLVTPLNALGDVIPRLIEVRLLMTAMALVEGNLENAPDSSKARRCLDQLRDMVRNELRLARAGLEAVPAPAGATPSASTLAEVCGFSQSPQKPESVVDRTWGMYFDLLGQLAALALQAEEELAGTEPLVESRV